jgi:hypothetical protein
MIDRRRKKPMTAAERQRARRQRLFEEAAMASPVLWLATVKKANNALALMVDIMRQHCVSVTALRALIERLRAMETDAHRAMWGGDLQ